MSECSKVSKENSREKNHEFPTLNTQYIEAAQLQDSKFGVGNLRFKFAESHDSFSSGLASSSRISGAYF